MKCSIRDENVLLEAFRELKNQIDEENNFSYLTSIHKSDQLMSHFSGSIQKLNNELSSYVEEYDWSGRDPKTRILRLQSFMSKNHLSGTDMTSKQCRESDTIYFSDVYDKNDMPAQINRRPQNSRGDLKWLAGFDVNKDIFEAGFTIRDPNSVELPWQKAWEKTHSQPLDRTSDAVKTEIDQRSKLKLNIYSHQEQSKIKSALFGTDSQKYPLVKWILKCKDDNIIPAGAPEGTKPISETYCVMSISGYHLPLIIPETLYNKLRALTEAAIRVSGYSKTLTAALYNKKGIAVTSVYNLKDDSPLKYLLASDAKIIDGSIYKFQNQYGGIKLVAGFNSSAKDVYTSFDDYGKYFYTDVSTAAFTLLADTFVAATPKIPESQYYHCLPNPPEELFNKNFSTIQKLLDMKNILAFSPRMKNESVQFLESLYSYFQTNKITILSNLNNEPDGKWKGSAIKYFNDFCSAYEMFLINAENMSLKLFITSAEVSEISDLNISTNEGEIGVKSDFYFSPGDVQHIYLPKKYKFEFSSPEAKAQLKIWKDDTSYADFCIKNQKSVYSIILNLELLLTQADAAQQKVFSTLKTIEQSSQLVSEVDAAQKVIDFAHMYDIPVIFFDTM